MEESLDFIFRAVIPRAQKLDKKRNSKLPCCLPIDLSRREWNNIMLRPEEFLATPKADGTRVFLGCLHGKYFTVNRELTHVVLDETVSRYDFLIDCEQVMVEQTTIYYLAFDCLSVRGESLCMWPLKQRLAALRKLNEQVLSKLVKIKVIVKPVCGLLDMEKQLLEKEPNATTTRMRPLWVGDKINIPCDGLIFMKATAPYRSFGNMLKWKITYTADLAVESQQTPARGGYLNAQNELVFQEIIHLGTVLPPTTTTPLTILECKGFVKEEGDAVEWKVVKIRADKSRPNYEKVVQDLKDCIRDPITLEQMAAALKNGSNRKRRKPN